MINLYLIILSHLLILDLAKGYISLIVYLYISIFFIIKIKENLFTSKVQMKPQQNDGIWVLRLVLAWKVINLGKHPYPCGFICTFNLAALNSNLKHTIYLYSFSEFNHYFYLSLNCEDNENWKQMKEANWLAHFLIQKVLN